jgi:hypothetical protein
MCSVLVVVCTAARAAVILCSSGMIIVFGSGFFVVDLKRSCHNHEG